MGMGGYPLWFRWWVVDLAEAKVAESQQEQVFLITVAFKGPGSALFDVRAQGVSPTQLLIAGEFLRMMGERQVHEGWTRETMTREREAQELARLQNRLKLN